MGNIPAGENRHLSAFPVTAVHSEYGPITEWGLSKREYFAALAMQGMASVTDDRYWTKTYGMTVEEWQASILERDAANAVRMADALLAELEKSNG